MCFLFRHFPYPYRSDNIAHTQIQKILGFFLAINILQQRAVWTSLENQLDPIASRGGFRTSISKETYSV